MMNHLGKGHVHLILPSLRGVGRVGGMSTRRVADGMRKPADGLAPLLAFGLDIDRV